MNENKGIRALYRANAVFYQTLWRQSGYIYFLRIGFEVIYALKGPFAALMLKLALERAAAGSSVLQVLLPLVGAAVYALLGNLLHTAVYGIYSDYAFTKAEIAVRRATLSHYYDLYSVYFDDPSHSDRAYRALEYSAGGGRELTTHLMALFGLFLSFAGYTVLLTTIDWKISVVILGITGLGILTDAAYNRRMHTAERSVTGERRQMAYYAQAVGERDVMDELKTAGSIRFFSEKHQAAAASIARKLFSWRKKAFGLKYFTETAEHYSTLASFILLGIQLVSGAIPLAQCAVFLSSIGSLRMSVEELFSYGTILQAEALKAQNYCEFMFDETYLMPEDDNAQPLNDIRSIEFKNVWFKYPGQTEYAVKDVSFRITDRMKVSIVGENGAGKTTLVNLIMRMYLPERGEILINGVDAGAFRIKDIWRCISAVFQNPVVYALTAAENVCFAADETADHDRICTALDKAGLGKKRIDWRKGIQTQMTHRFSTSGVQLSGGQQQKLAAARAYYKPCSVYVLDEPSSSLDAVSEVELYQSMTDAAHDHIMFFISHRLTSVKITDYVIYMCRGQVADQGVHAQLYARCKAYRELYQMQADRYLTTV